MPHQCVCKQQCRSCCSDVITHITYPAILLQYLTWIPTFSHSWLSCYCMTLESLFLIHPTCHNFWKLATIRLALFHHSSQLCILRSQDGIIHLLHTWPELVPVTMWLDSSVTYVCICISVVYRHVVFDVMFMIMMIKVDVHRNACISVLVLVLVLIAVVLDLVLVLPLLVLTTSLVVYFTSISLIYKLSAPSPVLVWSMGLPFIQVTLNNCIIITLCC